jgi:hypothetical protein
LIEENILVIIWFLAACMNMFIDELENFIHILYTTHALFESMPRKFFISCKFSFENFQGSIIY